MKASIQTINNRLYHVENRISLLEDDFSKNERIVYNLEKTIQQHELDIEEISANLKRANRKIIGIEEGIETETKGINNIFREVILENFPNIEREVDTQVQETYRTPNRQDQRRGSPRHIIVKLTNVEAKERILKAARERTQVTYRGKTIRITPDLPNHVMKARRACGDIFQTLRENNFQPRFTYPAKISIKIDGEIKTFQDKQKLKEFMSAKPTLEKVLKEINYKEETMNKRQNQRNNNPHQTAN